MLPMKDKGTRKKRGYTSPFPLFYGQNLQSAKTHCRSSHNEKIPSEMEEAPRYKLFTLLTWFTLMTRGMRGTTVGKTGLRPKTPFEM